MKRMENRIHQKSHLMFEDQDVKLQSTEGAVTTFPGVNSPLYSSAPPWRRSPLPPHSSPQAPVPNNLAVRQLLPIPHSKSQWGSSLTPVPIRVAHHLGLPTHQLCPPQQACPAASPASCLVPKQATSTATISTTKKNCWQRFPPPSWQSDLFCLQCPTGSVTMVLCDPG